MDRVPGAEQAAAERADFRAINALDQLALPLADAPSVVFVLGRRPWFLSRLPLTYSLTCGAILRSAPVTDRLASAATARPLRFSISTWPR
jgi:hypothetical protein